MPAPTPPTPNGQSFYPIRFAECSKCGAEFAYCALEMLNPFVEKSHLGICHGCLFGESMAGMVTMKITSRMSHEIALQAGGACG